jgi:hypothetical protein
MAPRKKIKKTSSTSKKSPTKRPALKGRTPRKSAKRKNATNKEAQKKRSRTIARKTGSGVRNERRRDMQRLGSSASSRESSGLQSGDLQGLSNVESVDSESVDELLEEGNAFEAGVVSGVEGSRERDGKEVRTREVPEDDVPGEYLEEE